MGVFEKAKNITDTDLRIVVTGSSDPAEALRRHVLRLEETQRQLKGPEGFLDRQREWLEESVERKLGLAEEWDKRAAAAVEADRDDLARHAIRRKKELLRSLNEDRQSLNDLMPQLEEVRSRLKNIRRKIAKAREVRATLCDDPEFTPTESAASEPATPAAGSPTSEDDVLDQAGEGEVDEELRRLKRRLGPGRDS